MLPLLNLRKPGLNTRLASLYGSPTTPVATITNTGANTFFPAALGGQLQLPFEQLYPGMHLQLTCYLRRTGTTASIAAAFGKIGLTSNVTNSSTWNQGLSTTDGLGLRQVADVWWDASAGKLVLTQNVTLLAGASPAFIEQAVAAGQTAFLELGCSAVNAADSLQLLAYMVDRIN